MSESISSRCIDPHVNCVETCSYATHSSQYLLPTTTTHTTPFTLLRDNQAYSQLQANEQLNGTASSWFHKHPSGSSSSTALSAANFTASHPAGTSSQAYRTLTTSTVCSPLSLTGKSGLQTRYSASAGTPSTPSAADGQALRDASEGTKHTVLPGTVDLARNRDEENEGVRPGDVCDDGRRESVATILLEEAEASAGNHRGNIGAEGETLVGEALCGARQGGRLDAETDARRGQDRGAD